MASHMVDSALFKDQFGTEEMRRTFDDRNLLQKWMDVEAALARAEAAVGLIPRSAAEEISRRCSADLLDVEAIKRGIDETSHPIVPFLHAYQAVCGKEAGECLHWGATTQDIIDTGMVLQIREAYDVIQRDVSEIIRIICDMARKYRDTLMAGRTHGVHALPITYGFKTAIWACELHRHRERLRAARPRVLVSSLFGAVGTLNSFGKDALEIQRLVSEDLGLDVPEISWHSARDGVAEWTALLGLLAGTLGKIANEIINLMKTEVDEVEEPFHHGKVGSSTMPHKRNPMICEAVVAASRIVRSHVPLALEVMMSEHERDMSAWQAEWEFVPEACTLTGAVLHQMKFVLSNLIVKPDNMRKNLDALGGLILSEAVMLRLGESIGRQTAHDLVYKISMETFEKGVPFAELLAKDEKVSAHLSPEEIEGLLDPANYVDHCGTLVDRAIAVCEAGSS
ncbi:MAG: adenylosuccinate lyase [Nitrospinota bacterium]|jgi:adenylosuccinate lyase|nr:adenylosuccinate lyase [Nitrospinota bacterium]MDP6619069.1 adenylosuccinate lyase [Nitrospinota bacterium]